MARGNDVACREAGDTKSTLISASWPSYTLSSMVRRSDNFPRNNVIFLRKYEIRSTENRQISTENTTFLRNSAALLQNNTAFARKICYILRNEYYFLWKEDVPNGPP